MAQLIAAEGLSLLRKELLAGNTPGASVSMIYKGNGDHWLIWTVVKWKLVKSTVLCLSD